MTMQLLLSWWNLIFELPLAFGLMYLALYCVSGWTFGDTDADTGGFEHDVDAHLDAHGEINCDHDADLSHDVNADAEHEALTDGENSSSGHSILSAMSWIGIGRMPFSLVLMMFLLCWGSIGFFAMQVQAGSEVERSVWIACAIAVVVSCCVTHFVASFLARTLFSLPNVARRRHELLGSFAEALYPINSQFGMACGRDDRGELFQVACVIDEGQKSIDKGAAVQLVSYTAKDRIFHVVPAETSTTPRRMVTSEK